jgi:hypothetical protein
MRRDAIPILTGKEGPRVTPKYLHRRGSYRSVRIYCIAVLGSGVEPIVGLIICDWSMAHGSPCLTDLKGILEYAYQSILNIV